MIRRRVCYFHHGAAVMLLSTTEAARRCGVCPRTVLRWLTIGEIDGVRTPGGHWRVRESDLGAFEARSKAAAAPVPTLRVVLDEDDPTEALALARLVEQGILSTCSAEIARPEVR